MADKQGGHHESHFVIFHRIIIDILCPALVNAENKPLIEIVVENLRKACPAPGESERYWDVYVTMQAV